MSYTEIRQIITALFEALLMVGPEGFLSKMNGADSEKPIVICQNLPCPSFQLLLAQVAGTVVTEIAQTGRLVGIKGAAGCADRLSMNAFMGEHLMDETKIRLPQAPVAGTGVRIW